MGNIFDCSTATKVPTEGDIQEAGEAKTFETNHFDANIDVSENLATILEKGGSKRVLLLIGGDWCVWSVRFCELLKGDARIQSALADNFEMMCVNFNANRSLCYQWAPKIAHTPWLAVVDGGGKVIAEQVCVCVCVCVCVAACCGRVRCNERGAARRIDLRHSHRRRRREVQLRTLLHPLRSLSHTHSRWRVCVCVRDSEGASP